MPTITVDLGNVTVRRNHANALSLSLTSSCTIELPPTWTGPPNASEIASALREGTLWIAKAGSCQLDFAVLVNGEPPCDRDIDEATLLKISDLAVECPVWQDIGLELRDKNPPNQDKSLVSFFLRHPNIPSSINAPLSVPWGKLQGLQCQVDLCYTSRVPKGSDSNQTRAGMKRYDLRSPRSEATGSGGEEDTVANPAVSEVRIDADETSHLLDAALRRLIGVGKKGVPGIKTVRKRSGPSLVEVAPAVWNLNYLQSVTSHAQKIPVVAAALARLSTTGPPSLREKLHKLACRGPLDDISNSDQNSQEDIKAEITKRMWLLCQTKIQANPVLKNGQKETMSQITPDEHMVNDASLESQNTQATFPATPYWSPYPGYVMIPMTTLPAMLNISGYEEWVGNASLGVFNGVTGDDSLPGAGQAELLPHNGPGADGESDLLEVESCDDGEIDEHGDVGSDGMGSDDEINGDDETNDDDDSESEWLYRDENGSIHPLPAEL